MDIASPKLLTIDTQKTVIYNSFFVTKNTYITLEVGGIKVELTTSKETRSALVTFCIDKMKSAELKMK